MKDLPHHIKKLNRKIVRSARREEGEFEAPLPPQRQTERQLKKQAKAKMKEIRLDRTPNPLTPEEQNRKMLHRVPVFDRMNSAKPRYAKPTKKKVPRRYP